MKVEIISRKFIKPSTPTHHSLRDHKISFIDELAPSMNVPFILYYPAQCNNDTAKNASLFNQLEKSLVETLTQFYPLAGRYIKDDHVIYCNDQGVDYVEARVDVQLLEFLDHGDKPQFFNQFIPRETGAVDETTDPLLSIQLSMFECGGLAVGVSIAHRIADASTLSTFLNAWAIASRVGIDNVTVHPSFNSVFVPGRNLPALNLGIPRSGDNGAKTRMFFFNKKAISTLRAKASTDNDNKGKRGPTRVQLVSAVIWRALVAVAQAKHGQPRASGVLQTINLRKKTVPSLPEHSCGNFWGLAMTGCMGDESKMELQGFVDLIGAAIRNTVTDSANVLSLGEDGHMKLIKAFIEANQNFSNAKMDSYLFTSWCRFPFYEIDFGWGKPVWTSLVSMPVKNFICLMDNKEGDGIEAWVLLDEKDMVNFEQDQTIRAFTT
ncbi:hypothetical protein ACSBR1_022541 [Camellia fascicularis]